MKLTISKSIGCALLVLTLAAECPATTFDFAQLVDNKCSTRYIEYPGLDQVQVLIGLSLPVQAALVALLPGESLENIDVTSGAPINMGIAAPQSLTWDEVTSSESAYAPVVERHNRADRLGGRPLHVVGEVSIDGGRYAELMIFPVTLEADDSLRFHPTITISIGGRTLSDRELLPRAEWLSHSADRRPSVTQTGSEYLIVTSAALVPALEPLAKYKTETGYRVEIDTIESILSFYPGRDDAEKLRERLKSFRGDGGRYVLLAGDETVVPIRYAYPNLATAVPPLDQMQVCDLYFADLTGDWDADLDGIWGERYTDGVDVIPELLVGRLPINTAEEAANYTARLIRYETDPGAGDRAYLERAFFFSSDQMRDYETGGQHGIIARAFPAWFDCDTTSAVEQATGYDLNPANLSPDELAPILGNGFGIVNVIAHGRSDGFVLKSADYNEWPKTYILSDNGGSGHGELGAISAPDRPAFYYSLACNNGGFDMEQPPMNQMNPSVVQTLLGGPTGAVGMVAYSRWGWISSSYLLQAAFFDSLFAHPDRPAIEALYASKRVVYYYRDLLYGLNFFGDPTLRVYASRPDKPDITLEMAESGLDVRVATGGVGAALCQVILSLEGRIISEHTSDAGGLVRIDAALEPTALYRLTAVIDGACVAVADFIPAMVTDVDDGNPEGALPTDFALYQNYPNPFNPGTTIDYDLPQASHVKLRVYNLLGQTVATLVDAYHSAGSYSINWNGENDEGEFLASGVYFYCLESAGGEAVRKMLLMK